MYSLIDSDELQGVIRNPFAFLFPIQWGFSGSIQTLPYVTPVFVRTPFEMEPAQLLFHSSF